MKRLWIRFNCFIGNHELTCKADQGIAPPVYIKDIKSTALIILEFLKYSQVYCKHCGKVL